MLKLKKGEVSEAPPRASSAGVIRVDDIRDAELPALEDIKPQIASQLEQQKMVQFQEDLRAKAKVE